MTRIILRRICRALIAVVMLAQMAVSAYACPGLSPGPTTGAAIASAAPLNGAIDDPAADCAGMTGPMDSDFANLCAEHCHQGQQSGQAATLSVPAALLTALYLTPLIPEPFVPPRPAAAVTSALAAASPPLAILHCCFRI